MQSDEQVRAAEAELEKMERERFGVAEAALYRRQEEELKDCGAGLKEAKRLMKEAAGHLALVQSAMCRASGFVEDGLWSPLDMQGIVDLRKSITSLRASIPGFVSPSYRADRLADGGTK